MTQPEHCSTRKLISKPNLLLKLGGISDTTLWRMERHKKIPSAIRMPGRRVMWDESEIDDWLENLAGHRAA